MTTAERSAALARALASEPGLPEDFAERVAAMADARDTARRAVWNYLGLAGAFVAMLAVCVAGWFTFAPHALAASEWIEPLTRALAAQPWLVIGAVAIAVVQALTFGRRARI